MSGTNTTNEYGADMGYRYNALGQAVTLTEYAKTYQFGHDNAGNMNKVTYPNSAWVTLGLNSVSRITSMTYNMGSTMLGGFSYTLGAAGNRTGVAETGPAVGAGPGRAVVWSPDDLYRLTGEAITGGSISGAVTHAYDDANNRLTKTSSLPGINSQNFTGQIDSTDRITATGYTWDYNGNMLTDSRGMTYTYNPLNRLTRVQGTGVDMSYTYNGDGLRVQKTNNLTGVVTRYLWDVNGVTGYPQAVEELQGGVVVRRYAYGPSGIISQTQKVGEDWVTSYFVRDATGTVRALMAEDGTITDVFSWTAWGELLEHVGSTSCDVGLHGEYRDGDTGLIYLRARWYSPDIGRFVTMDNFEGDQGNPTTLNKYSGFNDDPTNRTDPSGYISDPYMGSINVPLNIVRPIWHQTATSSYQSENIAFFTFSGYNSGKRPGMELLFEGSRNYFKGTFKGGYYKYSETQNAVGKIRQYVSKNPQQKLKVFVAGHSLGGSSTVSFARQIQHIPNVEVIGVYLVDAVGYSRESDPGTEKNTFMLDKAGCVRVNPSEIPEKAKYAGLIYQRIKFPFGVSSLITQGATTKQFIIESLTYNHTQIDDRSSGTHDLILNAADDALSK